MCFYKCSYRVKYRYPWGNVHEFTKRDVWDTTNPANLPRYIKQLWQLVKASCDVEIMDLVITPVNGGVK